MVLESTMTLSSECPQQQIPLCLDVVREPADSELGVESMEPVVYLVTLAVELFEPEVDHSGRTVPRSPLGRGLALSSRSSSSIRRSALVRISIVSHREVCRCTKSRRREQF